MMRFLLIPLLWLATLGVAQAQQNDQLIEILQQMMRMESEFRQLRGQVEQLEHESRRLKSQQNDLYTDIDQRLRAIEGGARSTQLPGTGAAALLPPLPVPATASAPAALPVVETQPPAQASLQPVAKPLPPAAAVLGTAPQTPSAEPPAPDVTAQTLGATSQVPDDAPQVPDSAPQTLGAVPPAGAGALLQAPPITEPQAPGDPALEQATYKAAFDLLKAGKYDQGIQSYTDFLQKYPSGDYAADAQYWLAEAHYLLHRYPVALNGFRKVVDWRPEARKSPDAMLKIGYIYYEFKQDEDARKTLQQLTRNYPGTAAATLATNRLARMKLEGR